MIRGVVNARLQGIVTLQATGPSGRMREINAVIDTGFTDFLTLSHEIIDELDLDFAINVQAFLADGSEEILPMFNVTVTWDGEPRRVRAIATRGESLLGMAMLHGRRLVVEVVEGGQVAVQPLN